MRGKLDQEVQIKKEEMRLASITSKIENYLSLIDECAKSMSDMDRRTDTLLAERDKVSDGILSLDDEFFKIDADILKLDKDTEIYEFWKLAFSAKGIRSLLLDRFCNQFNSLVNDYLSVSSNGEMSIILNPVKVLKSGEDRNKLSLEINMASTLVKYDSLSGGEKRRVDVSLCLALNKWLSNRYGLSNGLLGLIIFDEIFSFLDREGEENIGNLLFIEGKDKIILVISHTPELNAYSSNTVNIIKTAGISSIMI
jgi:DNA repair exonuclease SbcCD ATPase subunit